MAQQHAHCLLSPTETMQHPLDLDTYRALLDHTPTCVLCGLPAMDFLLFSPEDAFDLSEQRWVYIVVQCGLCAICREDPDWHTQVINQVAYEETPAGSLTRQQYAAPPWTVPPSIWQYPAL